MSISFHETLFPSRFSKSSPLYSHTLCGFLTVVLFASAALADNFWQKKNYKTWTMSEVHILLDESPWTKNTVVDHLAFKDGFNVSKVFQTDCNGNADFSNYRSLPPDALSSNSSAVEFKTTWISSRSIRSALMREAILCGRTKVPADKIDEFLVKGTEFYEIKLTSGYMQPFEGIGDEVLLNNTWISFDNNQTRVNPTNLEFIRDENKTIHSIIFRFNKKSENGHPLITPEQKEVEFAIQLDKLTVRTKYQLSKMTIDGELDL
jgi:hypothetical protein